MKLIRRGYTLNYSYNTKCVHYHQFVTHMCMIKMSLYINISKRKQYSIHLKQYTK